MYIRTRYLMLLIALITITGCDVFISKPDSVVELDLSDASYIGIDQSISSTNQINNLIKISDKEDLNSFENIEFVDNNGTILGPDVVHADAWTIHPASELYTIIAGEFIFKEKSGEKRHFGLLLNNQSGEIYGLEEYYYPEQKYGLTGSFYYQTDRDGNIYFVNPTDSHMYRILVGDGSKIQLEKYIDGASGINGGRYLVDQDGNVYFKNGSRVKKSTGGIEETQMEFVAINGSDGICYAFGQEWPSNLAMYKLDILEGQFHATKISESGFWFEQGINLSFQFTDQTNRRSIIMAQGYLIPEQSFVDRILVGIIFDEQNYTLTPILYSDMEYMEVLGTEKEFLWSKRSNTKFEAFDILSINNETNQNTAVITESIVVEIPSELDLNSAIIDHCGVGINLSGFILSEEAKFAGKITVDEGLQYYKEETVPFITTLSRVK